MIGKLRRKFVLVNMSIVTIMLLVIFGLFFYFTRNDLETKSIEMMRQIAEDPSAKTLPDAPALEEESVRLPFFVLRIQSNGDVEAVGDGYYDLSDQEFLEEMATKALSSSRAFGVIDTYGLRYYTLDTKDGKRIVFSDISSEKSTLANMQKSCLAIGIVSFFLFLLISIRLSRWAVRPIEEAWAGQKKFVADASHELKTPLTVILTNSYLALSGEYPREKRLQCVQNVQTVAEHMKTLIEQMLELARSDQGEIRRTRERIDFSAVVSDALLTFEAAFFESGHPVDANVQEDVVLYGDQRQILRLPEIFLDNAVKYAKKDGRVSVSLRRRGRSACLLTVANEAEPLTPGELENLFKRFYRADPAREQNGSFGLGLSIAKTIAEGHRGKVWAESRDGSLFFYTLLPCGQYTG